MNPGPKSIKDLKSIKDFFFDKLNYNDRPAKLAIDRSH